MASFWPFFDIQMAIFGRVSPQPPPPIQELVVASLYLW